MGGLSFGSDPEFMLMKDGAEEPALTSAIKVLRNHGKTNKLPIAGSQAMFYDNVLVEFNIDPGHTLADFMHNFSTCLNFASKALAEKDCSLKAQASAVFPASECDDEEAFVFGCDPEFCIYHMSPEGAIVPMEPPSLPQGNTFRSCGGHIHLGHPIATIERGNPPIVVKLMDAFVGATALLIDKDKTSAERRKLYGGAGTHRITPYGLEYRTLSNFWLATPLLTEIIYKLSRIVIQQALTNPEVIDHLIKPKELQALINTGNVSDASALYAKTRRFMPHELQFLIEQAQERNHLERIEYEWEDHLIPLQAAA